MTEQEWIKAVEGRVKPIHLAPQGYYEEWQKLPTKQEEEEFLELIRKRAPFLVVTYVASLLKYIPGVGPWLSDAVKTLIKWRIKGVEQKEIF